MTTSCTQQVLLSAAADADYAMLMLIMLFSAANAGNYISEIITKIKKEYKEISKIKIIVLS
jgi:hypothetical protein